MGRSKVMAGLMFAGGLMVAGGTVPAHAQDSRAAQERACSHDVSRHCRRYISEGDMAIFQCLQANRERLSGACRRVVDSH